MTQLRLGFFPKFNGEDVVLLSGAPADIEWLSRRLAEFVLSSERELALHTLAAVVSSHAVQLFISRDVQGASGGFRWLCSNAEIATVQEKLEALSASSKGHQYFDLTGSPVQLMISVGEYAEAWWQYN